MIWQPPKLAMNSACVSFTTSASAMEYLRKRRKKAAEYLKQRKDSMNHGMGIRNIKDILEKNGGVLNIDVNACEFTVNDYVTFGVIKLAWELRNESRHQNRQQGRTKRRVEEIM